MAPEFPPPADGLREKKETLGKCSVNDARVNIPLSLLSRSCTRNGYFYGSRRNTKSGSESKSHKCKREGNFILSSLFFTLHSSTQLTGSAKDNRHRLIWLKHFHSFFSQPPVSGLYVARMWRVCCNQRVWVGIEVEKWCLCVSLHPLPAERIPSLANVQSFSIVAPFFAQASQQDVSFPEGKVKETANESANLKFPCRFPRLEEGRVWILVHHPPDHKESASILSLRPENEKKERDSHSLSSLLRLTGKITAFNLPSLSFPLFVFRNLSWDGNWESDSDISLSQVRDHNKR